MKKPRVNDFDPKLASPLDGMPEILSPRSLASPAEAEAASEPYPSLDRVSDPSTDRSISKRPFNNRVLEKPRGFYITERLDRRLDEAVRYFKEQHGIKKVDRSVVVTAMLDNEANFSEEALDLLVDRVLSQLTSRLTGK